MKTIHKLKISLCILFFALLAVSCLRDQETIGDAGSTFLKLHPAGYNMAAFDAKTTPQEGILFEIRRDVANKAQLNSTSQVVLTVSDAIITKYNDDNETEYIPFPSNLGTVTPSIVNGEMTVDFKAGDIGQAIKIAVPSAASFDFSKHYALGFAVKSVSGTGTLSAAVYDTVVVEILAKNIYDGKYKMKGFIMRPGDTGGLEGFFSGHEKKLSTAGAKSVTMSPNQLWANGGGVGGIGTWTITIDDSGAAPYPITVTDPVAVNWKMDPAYPNRYDPAKKTFYFKVNWGATIPYIRGCTDTLVWTGN